MILSSHPYFLQSVENKYEITNDDDDDLANMQLGHMLPLPVSYICKSL
jgi:hypothetical protein